MSLPTLVVTPEELASSRVEITGDAYRHLFRSRRLAVGDSLRLVDGDGQARSARVESVDRDRAGAVVGDALPSAEPMRSVEIWAALPRPQRASWMVEKATELGATAVRWIDCERSGRQPSEGAIERHLRVGRSAVEQCGRSRLPAITGPHAWSEVLERVTAGSLWLLDASATHPPREPTRQPSSLLVGPEGGLTSREIEDLEERGAGRLALGRRILRVETAALAGLAVLLAGDRPPPA